MTATISSVRPEDEARRHDLRRQAFGGTATFDPEAPTLDPDRVVGGYVGDELVGSVVTLAFEQTWGGRSVPCGGVAGVIVAPEVRGQGLARRMLAESFERMRGRGEIISALYPTTASLYRSVGYETVSWFERRQIGLDLLPSGDDGWTWRRADLDDPAVLDVLGRCAGQHDGWFRPDTTWWDYRIHEARRDTGTNRFVYVGGDEAGHEAVVQFRYGTSERALYSLDVEVLAADDVAGIRNALAFLRGHGTTVDVVQTSLPRHLLELTLAQVQRTKVADTWPWMLRLVDAPAAFAARGWPAPVRGRIELDVVDPVVPANEGPHVLEIDGGEAALTAGGSGRVRTSIQSLARVYAGGDPGAIASAGGLEGATGADLALLRAACATVASIPLFF